MLTGTQIRAARAIKRWSAQELAEAAGVGISTVQRMESVDGVPSASAKNLDAVQKALEAAGVVFVDANGLGPGVRLRDKG
jgi:transcriptional regulator with XRE-family HTH domain